MQISKCYLLLVCCFSYHEIVRTAYTNVDCSKDWTPIRGNFWFTSTIEHIECPYNGIISKIRYTIRLGISSMQFSCSSALGITHTKVYGKKIGIEHEIGCEESEHIQYFTYVLEMDFIKKIDVVCIKTTRSQIQNSKIAPKNVAKGAEDISDKCFTTNGRRPVEMKFAVHYMYDIVGIQTRYLDVPVRAGCIVSHVEVLHDLTFEKYDFEVLGFTSGSTCSELEQQISLDIAQSSALTIESEKSFSGGIAEMGAVGIDNIHGFKSNMFPETEFRLSGDLSATGQHVWGSADTDSYTKQYDYTMGTTINYPGPGIALLVGFRVVFTANEKEITVRHHFTCEKGGSKPPTDEKYPVNHKKFGSVFFLDYQRKFNDTSECLSSSYTQECVSSIKIRNFIAHPEELETEFLKCFNSKVNIPFEV